MDLFCSRTGRIRGDTKARSCVHTALPEYHGFQFIRSGTILQDATDHGLDTNEVCVHAHLFLAPRRSDGNGGRQCVGRIVTQTTSSPSRYVICCGTPFSFAGRQSRLFFSLAFFCFLYENAPLTRRQCVSFLSHNQQGSPTEWNYKLMTFGIPVESLPITAGLMPKYENHKRWMARRISRDAFLSEGFGVASSAINKHFDGIDFPGPNDVLLGRGKPFTTYTGNVRLRNLVELHRSLYDKLKRRGEKAKLAESIVEMIRRDSEPKGRFLKIHEKHGWWIVANMDESIEKVAQAFRTARSASVPSSTKISVDRNNKNRSSGNGGGGGSGGRSGVQGGGGNKRIRVETIPAPDVVMPMPIPIQDASLFGGCCRNGGGVPTRTATAVSGADYFAM